MKATSNEQATASPTESEWMLNGPDYFKKMVMERRATRHFTDEPVPETVLRTILSLAQQAPSGYNFQPWRFVILRDAESRARLRGAAFDQEKITEAPVMVVAFAQREGWKEKIDAIFELSTENGAMPPGAAGKAKNSALGFLAGLEPAVWLNRQVMIAFTFLMLAAEALGWDTAPMEGFDAGKVRAALELPDDAEVIALLAIGRAAKPIAQYPGRLPLEQIVHEEKYGRPWKASIT